MQLDELRIQCDGGARGNPGPAAIGVVIKSLTAGAAEEIAAFGKQIGEATNNTAEYQAVIAAFSYLKDRGVRAKKITVLMDSQVVARQLTGEYKIKKLHLQKLHDQAKQLEPLVGEQIRYETVPREKNSAADKLLNNALDTNS